MLLDRFSADQNVSPQRRAARGLVRATAVCIALLGLSWSPALADHGDAQRGVSKFRECAACHALLPGVHTTGPSLAGLFERPAGTAEGFGRYSEGLRNAGFDWTLETLDAWLADPAKMIPGTFMDILGNPDARARADIISFLEIAGGPDGATKAMSMGLIDSRWAAGVSPAPIGNPTPEKRVAEIRHCGDSFFITNGEGRELAYWEKNVRLKIDSTETGPPEGVPVLIESGRMGDRAYVIFRTLSDLQSLIAEKC